MFDKFVVLTTELVFVATAGLVGSFICEKVIDELKMKGLVKNEDCNQ